MVTYLVARRNFQGIVKRLRIWVIRCENSIIKKIKTTKNILEYIRRLKRGEDRPDISKKYKLM